MASTNSVILVDRSNNSRVVMTLVAVKGPNWVLKCGKGYTHYFNQQGVKVGHTMANTPYQIPSYELKRLCPGR